MVLNFVHGFKFSLFPQNFWCQAKRKLKWMAGVSRSTLEGHMSEFLYRHRNNKDGTPLFNAIIRDIAAQYDVIK